VKRHASQKYFVYGRCGHASRGRGYLLRFAFASLPERCNMRYTSTASLSPSQQARLISGFHFAEFHPQTRTGGRSFLVYTSNAPVYGDPLAGRWAHASVDAPPATSCLTEQNCREACRQRPSLTGMVKLPAGNEGFKPRQWTQG